MKKTIYYAIYIIVTVLILWRLLWWGKNYTQERLKTLEKNEKHIGK